MRISEIEGLQPDQILAYIRKSRSDDPNMDVNEILEKHEKLIDDFTSNVLGFKIPATAKYKEIASSETIADRKEMLKLLHDIENPRIKAVVVVEPQRLSRGDLEDIGKITKLFKHTNTLIITPTISYDLSDDYDKDAFERELKRGNEYLEYFKKIQSRGRLLSVQAGNYIGSKPPYGYKVSWIQEGKKKCPILVPDESEAYAVKLIFDMFANQGLKHTNIARQLDSLGIKPRNNDHWHPSSIKRILINVHYIGKVKWNHRKTVKSVKDMQLITSRPLAKEGEYLIFEGKHEALIDEETFKKANELLGSCTKEKPNTELVNPFAGVLHCQCGSAMCFRPSRKSKEGKPQQKHRLLCQNQVHCHTPSVIFDDLIDAVCDSLQKSIDDFQIKINSNNGNEADLHQQLIDNLIKKKKELEEKELLQWDLQADPDSSKRMPQHIFIKLNEKLQNEKKKLMKPWQMQKLLFPKKLIIRI